MVQDKRQLRTKDIVGLANALRHDLAQVADLENNPTLDRLPVDIADIYEGCLSYMQLVDELLALRKPWDRQHVLRLLADIYDQLFVHLPTHYKRLPRGLNKLAIALEPNRSRREALADRRLRSTLLKGKTIIKKLKAQEALPSPKRKRPE